jgi:hypothetical protein
MRSPANRALADVHDRRMTRRPLTGLLTALSPRRSRQLREISVALLSSVLHEL